MPQTEKAKQASQQNQQEAPQEQNRQAEALKEALAPLMATVKALQADKEQEAADKIATQETARQAKLDKDADIAAMLSDPNTSDAGEDKFEQMTKRQIVDLLASAMETALEANAVKIKSDIGQSKAKDDEKIAVIEKAVYAILGKMGVKDSRDKHKDFDDYQDAISKIMGEIPGITFERAYVLAKGEAGAKGAHKSETDSEKPTDTAWQPQGRAQGGVLPNQNALQAIADRGRESREEATVTKSGTVGIRNIINAGINKVMAANEQQSLTICNLLQEVT